MLMQAGKYARLREPSGKPAPASRAPDASRPAAKRLQILVPKKGAFTNVPDALWRELREGGYLQRYLEREKAQRDRRARRAAQLMDGRGPNPKSDMKLLFALPIRDAMRLEQDRPGFLEDDWNLRWLKRQNPDLPIFV